MLTTLMLQFGGFYARALFPTLKIIALIIGVGLLFNSLRGLLSREGMYDQQSRQQMLISGWLGVVGGVLLIYWGAQLFI
jgi:hypothetical protein